MSRTLREYLDAPSSNRLTVGDVRFRKEPDEEEDEEEEDKKGGNQDEEGTRMTTKMVGTRCDRVLIRSAW